MRWYAILTALAMSVLGGCVPTKMDVPTGFVSLDKEDRGPYDQRAVSADGVVIACRTQPKAKHGTLEFWAEAIENELADRPGYTRTSSDPVESDAGLPGRLLEFSVTRSGAALTYLVGVFVKGDQVILYEAGGRAEPTKRHMRQIRSALLSLH